MILQVYVINIFKPSPINRMPLKRVNFFWHIISLRYFPAVTAITANKIFAATAPEKMLIADKFGTAARPISANCVLSPNSAKNVVVNEFRMTALAGREIFEDFFILFFACRSVSCPLNVSSSALIPKIKNVIPDTIFIVSIATNV